MLTIDLYRFLRSQGIDFPDDPAVAHALRDLLPRLAAHARGKGWERTIWRTWRARGIGYFRTPGYAP